MRSEAIVLEYWPVYLVISVASLAGGSALRRADAEDYLALLSKHDRPGRLEAPMDEELSWAERMDHPIQWPFRLADLPEAHLAAEVLRRGNRMD